ncbi:MAG: RrF2 family transcriptional regulator [Ginsengibacter sp.]
MFSKSTEYALRATLYIAQKASEEKKIGIDEISAAIGSPKSFTAKILQTLTKNNKVVRSASGPHGGFYVSPKAKKLPVQAILQAMGEDEMIAACVLGLSECSGEHPCPLHAKYKTIKRQLISLFESQTIGQLADQMEADHSFITLR